MSDKRGSMKTLDSFDFKGKTVILRPDLNSDVVSGRVIFGERIKASAETVKELARKKAKVVIIAHQGSPGKSDFISLKQHCRLLNRFVRVKFVGDVVGEKAVSSIKSLKNGEVLLLENIRFINDEFKPYKGKRNKLFRLAEIADYYVNDAFSVCHREQFSIVGFPKYLKSCAGRLLEREVNALKKISIKECLYILGGAKPSDNIKLLGRNKVLACGLFGQVCLIAKGKKLGEQERYLKREKIVDRDILKKLNGRLGDVLTPLDFAVKIRGKREEIDLEDFPSNFEIFDIGEKTIQYYVKKIRKARAIYMKGPAGFASEKQFSKGTVAILKAVAKSRAYSVIGGGHLSDAIEKYKINKNKFSHISLSGGALLNYIAGEKLAGLEVLR